MWKYIKHLFKYIFARNRLCVDCDYMRKCEYGYDAGLWRCTASCGNDEGKPCGAWFPRMPGREAPDASAKFFKARRAEGPGIAQDTN